jgi:sugar phosphate isomerase/epimerase
MTGALDRRTFLELGAAFVGAAYVGPNFSSGAPYVGPNFSSGAPYVGPNFSSGGTTICFFSKHLPSMDWNRLGQAVKATGFGGVDLTVRPNGHVAPERVASDLPRALEAIGGHGLSVPMITTALVSAEDPAARPTLETAARLGIRLVKTGYYSYAYSDVRAELATVVRQFAGLAALAASCGVTLGFHNHTGNVGASGWDAAAIVDPTDPRAAGYYFDAAHAVVEGGGGGWRAFTSLAATRLRMVAVKDFVWAKGERGWRPRWVPLGDGVVDWRRHFADLAAARFGGPISLHLEYLDTAGDASSAERRTLEAGARDLTFLRAGLEHAYAR